MAKKRSSWFDWVKKLFISEAKTKTEKKSKRRKCIPGRLLKFRQFAALTAPERTLNEAKEEQRKHAVNVAAATAAAAEAAVAAAHAAAEVVRLMDTSKSYHQFTENERNLAAIKIQSAFRAFLARKALRALKGLVRLQAIVRGRAVRRQAKTTLKCLPSVAEKQSDVKGRNCPTTDEVCKYGEYKKFFGSKEEFGEQEIKPECNSQRSWDLSVLSKEDIEAIWLRKQDAFIKRERMMKYSYSHRERRNVHMLEESIPHKDSRRSSCHLEKGAEARAYNGKESLFLKPAMLPNLLTGEIYIPTQVKLRNVRMHKSLDGLNSPHSFPRRSFCRNQHDNTTSRDENSGVNSPVFPTYMGATQSAKAKARSTSTPRQRAGFLDSCFGHSVPYNKNDQLSLWSSYNGEPFTSNGKSCTSQLLSLSTNNHH